jgi:glycosyltransferase involved in cell wall biosynthesis
VVSAVGGLQHLVADGRDGFFFPAGDAEACADRLRTLLQNPERRMDMGAAGRDKARNEYSWPVIAERTEAIYQRAEERVRTRR